MAANERPKYDYEIDSEVFEGLEPLDPYLPWEYYPNETTTEKGSKEKVVVSPVEKEPPSAEQQLPPLSPVVDKEMDASDEAVVVSPMKDELSPVVDKKKDSSEEEMEEESSVEKDPTSAEQQLPPLPPVGDKNKDASGSRSRGRPKRELKWPDWLPSDWHIQTKKRKSGQIDKFFQDPTLTHRFRSKKFVLEFLEKQKESDVLE